MYIHHYASSDTRLERERERQVAKLDQAKSDMNAELDHTFMPSLTGGLYIDAGNLTVGGDISFKECTSLASGGGILISRGDMQQKRGRMSFHNCTAFQNGGGISMVGVASQAGSGVKSPDAVL